MHVQTLASQAIGAVYSVYIVTLSAVPIRFFYSGFTMPIPLPRHATPKVFIFFQGERVIRDPLVAEANIVFGLHAHATSLVTIAKLRKHFSKSESRAVAHKVFVYGRNKVILSWLFYSSNTATHTCLLQEEQFRTGAAIQYK